MSEDTKPIMDKVGHLYHVKENSAGPPIDILAMRMKSGIECWAVSSDSYVREAIVTVEILLWSKAEESGVSRRLHSLKQLRSLS